MPLLLPMSVPLLLMLLMPLLGCYAAATIKTYENASLLLPPCHLEDLGSETRVSWWRAGVLLADSSQEKKEEGKQQRQQQPDGANATMPRFKMWANRSLELTRVRPEDSGEYVCQATRPEPWGHVTQVHQIQVIYPASVKPVPESGLAEVKLGEEVELRCAADGLPPPTFTWSFEGAELPVLAAGPRLRIHASNLSLAGVYTCEANNGIGEPARANIQLRIKHKPEVRPVTRLVHSAPGIRAKLQCLVLAWPEAQLEWLFEGQPLGRASRRLQRYKQDGPEEGQQLHSLVVRSLEPENLGQYVCRASNELGSAEASLELTGAPRPPILKKVSRASSSSSTSRNIVWEVDSYSPIVEYQFWFRQMNSKEDWRRLTIPNANEPAGFLHMLSFNFTGLQSSRQYEALVLARNHFGWSSPSNIVQFTTVPALPEVQEQEVFSEKIPSAVQVTSETDRSSAEANSSGCVKGNYFTQLLPLLLVFLASHLSLRTIRV